MVGDVRGIHRTRGRRSRPEVTSRVFGRASLWRTIGDSGLSNNLIVRWFRTRSVARRAVALLVASYLISPFAVAQARVSDADAVRIAVFRHRLDAVRDSVGFPQPVFVALGSPRSRSDPSRIVLAGLANTGIDVRPFSQIRRFEKQWLAGHPAPRGDSEAENTGMLMTIERLHVGPASDATADIVIIWYAVGRGDYGSTELRRVSLRRHDTTWAVTGDVVVSAAG